MSASIRKEWNGTPAGMGDKKPHCVLILLGAPWQEEEEEAP